MAKAYVNGVGWIEKQEKSLDVSKDGTYNVSPDQGKLLSKVTFKVDTPDKKPEVELDLKITENGKQEYIPPEGSVYSKVSLDVSVLNAEAFDNRLDGIIALQNGYIGGGFKPSEGLEYCFNENSYSVRGIGSCTDEVVVIPPEYEGYPVTSIEMLESKTMKELILPDSVTWIASTINGCTALERVVFGANFGSVNYWSFEGNVNCKVYDFSRCLQIPTIDLYDDPEYSVFSDMPDDCKMLVPPHLLDEWKGATNWTMFADHIVAAESVADNGTAPTFDTTEERLEAIEGNVPKVYEAGKSEAVGIYPLVLTSLIDRSITEIEIPVGVTEVGWYAFDGCKKLASVSIPDSVVSIGINAFHDCTALTEIVIPDSVTRLYGSCFHGCTGLESVIISDNIAELPSNLFYQCAKIKSLILPSKLTTIQVNALACDNCEVYDFTKCKVVPELKSVNGIKCSGNCRVLVPSSLYEEWIATTNWVTYKDYIVASDAKSAPNQDNFSIYVDAHTLKEIVDYNFLGITLASGVGKSEIHYEGEMPYLRLYGDGVSSEACARLRNIEGTPTGKYLVFAYRLPTTNVETYTGMQVFATTDGNDITGAGDMFYMTAEKDDKWHVGVIDIEEAIKSSKWVADGPNTCKFNPSSDGTYTISRLRLDWFNKVTSVDSYIDVAYVGICDTLDKAISADADYTGREFDADYFVNALGSNAVKNSYNGMDYVTISSTIPSNGEERLYLFDGGEEAMLLGASHYIGVLCRNAPEQYCEFHANSSNNLTDSRWYSTQNIAYSQGEGWKFMLFSLPKLADTVCRKLRVDFFNKLTAGTQQSIDIAFVKFFGSEAEANGYYEEYADRYGI